MYSVRQTTDKQRLNMTLYRLKKGGDMLTLNVTVGKDTHSVSTVKVGESGVALGSGNREAGTQRQRGHADDRRHGSEGRQDHAGRSRVRRSIDPLASNGL